MSKEKINIKFKPLETRVLIKKNEREEKTAGGIFIPQTANHKVDKGTVLAVGKLCEELKVNDKILFDKHSGTDIEIGTETYTILMEANVLCVI